MDQTEFIALRSALSGLTLDIRGRRVEDALRELERFLDRALLADIQVFSVIHGKGEGILQNLVHKTLKGPSGRRFA